MRYPLRRESAGKRALPFFGHIVGLETLAGAHCPGAYVPLGRQEAEHESGVVGLQNVRPGT